MRHSKVSTSSSRPGWSTPVMAGLPLLLLPSLALAQNAPVTPADNAPANQAAGATAPAPALPAPLAGLVGQPRIDIALNDVPVAKALEMISEYGEIDIIIGPDVDNNLILRRIALKGVAPEEAIQKVARASFLQWAKTGPKEYLVAKNLPASTALASPTVNIGNAGAVFTAPNPGVPDGSISANTNSNIPRVLIPNNSVEAAVPVLPQLIDQDTDAVSERRASRAIPIKNVKPGMMAWWLDPSHQPKPIEIVSSERSQQKRLNHSPARPIVNTAELAAMRGNISVPSGGFNNPYADDMSSGGGAYGQFRGNAQFGTGRNTTNRNNNRNNNRNTTGNRTGGDVFDLPEGVDKIIAVDSQNVLLVYGTEEGVRELETLISYLDRPLQQVEIEAQFVAVTNTDVRQFGIDFNSSNGPFTTSSNGLSSGSGTFRLGFVRGNFQATLNALVTNRRAKAIQSPRVTAINNLTAEVSFNTSTPFILTSTTTGIGGQVGTQQDAFVLETNIGLIVTPTINADGTITVLMEPNVAIQDPQTSANSIPGFTEQYVRTVANVRDGDTLALGGLRTRQVTREKRGIPILRSIPILGKMFSGVDNSSVDTDLIIFLTARIVHRPEDTAPVPGT